jgi:hypothetical protein
VAPRVDNDPVHVPEQVSQRQVPDTVVPSVPGVPVISILGSPEGVIWNCRFEIGHGVLGDILTLPDASVVPPQFSPERVYVGSVMPSAPELTSSLTGIVALETGVDEGTPAMVIREPLGAY